MDQYLRNTPKITFFLISSSILLSSLTSMKLVSKSSYSTSFKSLTIIKSQSFIGFPIISIFEFIESFTKWELWRPLTSFLYYGDFDLNFLIHTLTLYNSSKDMELQGSAQYLYFIFLVYLVSIILSIIIFVPFLSDIFFLAVVYVSCRRNRDMKIALIGLPFHVPAAYLPYVLVLLGPGYSRLAGIVVGHAYYYFEEVYAKLPHSKGVRVLACPRIFYKISDYLKL
jgi:Derlin-2/3